MTTKTKKAPQKAPRITNPKAITGKATKAREMAAEVSKATEGARSVAESFSYLVRLGYGKLAATTGWARKHTKPAKKGKKSARKPAKKVARKPAKKAAPAPTPIAAAV